MFDNKTISSFENGDEFIGFYSLKRCELKESDGSYRLEIDISDKTGTISGVIWDDALQFKDSLKKGNIVKIKGYVSTYRDKLQVRIEKIRIAEKTEYDLSSFIPETDKNIDELFEKVLTYIESISDHHLKKLGKLIFDDPVFKEQYIKCPGGTQWHHPYIGGLIEHSLGVASICEILASQYGQLNRDILLIAAILHDVGKIDEYSVSTQIEYSDAGRLVGHMILGDRFINEKIKLISDFPLFLKTELSHLILSHQGHREFGSPVEPMTSEAFVLYFADEIDSKLNAIERIRKKTKDTGEYWSDYVKILNRYLYFGEKEE